jgi:hypothetical protein
MAAPTVMLAFTIPAVAACGGRIGIAVIVSANKPGVNGPALPAGARFPSAIPRPGDSPRARTSIWGNSEENGGGIYDVGVQPESSLQFTDDRITGNYASADGGGILTWRVPSR